jgi:hypothetical protein
MTLAEQLIDELCEATTVIDTSVEVKDIANFSKLPPEVQAEIKKTESIRSIGFQVIIGYKGRKAVWSAGGSWSKPQGGKFTVENFFTGDKKIKWRG